MISRREALALVKGCSKFSHLLLTSELMKRLAQKIGEDSLEWELVGLLHDRDFDVVGSDMSKHGVVAADRLRNRLPDHCLYAIKAHDYRTGFKPRSKLDKALIAVDSLAVLMVEAQAKIDEPNIQDLKDTLSRLSLEKPWHRSNIQKCYELHLTQEEFLKIAISQTKRESFFHKP